ncbi:protein L-Myc-1b [Gadus chalcogrammus]|uniref:protein L-Myc-1b n=1 Tax=Gadus chalcogrammus TaxID=1042646 RepID=UPI0024C48DEE|nr:protein L-Myc-1b [Gadus chalcogrammus]XP_056438857.1 protein L-Myc-1b [Gadus chalcogrammus]
MPGISSTAPRYENGEMEYDHYQHYFYDDHDPDEDFFKSTAPSEDIWKKFELVPTPPMSPIRTVEGAGKVGPVHQSLGDRLELMSQFLGQDEEQDLPCKVNTVNDSFSNLSSIIIQDCMWSGFSAGLQAEKVVEERIASHAGSVAAKVPTAPGVQSSGRTHCVSSDAPLISSLATDCVDPAAILTFPLTGGCKKPQVSSGSESHTDTSDDEDDDEDEDDEDDEEIDVVTVEHQQQQHKSRRLVNSRQPVTITVCADHLDPCMKRFHISIHQQQHNYAAPSPDTLPDPPRKRARPDGLAHQPLPHPSQNSLGPYLQQPRPGHTASNPTAATTGGRCGAGSRSPSPDPASSPSTAASSFYEMPSSPPASGSSSPPSQGFSSYSHSHLSSPQSSDGEDTDKRRAHNFLERKRRNDLRSRFLLLRDEIPGLADCPKTPKVAILTRATQYLQQLHAGERQKAQERRQLKARQLQLQRRLAQLRRC